MNSTETSQGGPLARLLDGNGGARLLDRIELASWQPEQGILWVQLNYTDSEDQRWLAELSLDKLVVDALLAEDTRPRTTTIGEGLLVSLRGVNLTPGADPEDMVSIRIWIEKGLVVTSRNKVLPR